MTPTPTPDIYELSRDGGKTWRFVAFQKMCDVLADCCGSTGQALERIWDGQDVEARSLLFRQAAAQPVTIPPCGAEGQAGQ